VGVVDDYQQINIQLQDKGGRNMSFDKNRQLEEDFMQMSD
jgi:hypothetical protein